MMVLGREEPLIKNKQIYALNEISGEIELSRVEDDGLNRYTFLWLGDFDRRDTTFANLLRHISAELNKDPCWLLIWETPRHENNLLPDPKIDLRNEQGWATHKGDHITLGQRLVDLDTLSGPEPGGHEPKYGDGGTFILMGDVPPATDLVCPPVGKTLQKFAYSREMAPSSPFLSWVRERRLTLAYFIRNMYSRLGMIVVTPDRLELDPLREKGFVDTLHDGGDAPDVWLLGDR